jgi:hypothetical protein
MRNPLHSVTAMLRPWLARNLSEPKIIRGGHGEPIMIATANETIVVMVLPTPSQAGPGGAASVTWAEFDSLVEQLRQERRKRSLVPIAG